jgi:ABC-2 type transport system permease protein
MMKRLSGNIRLYLASAWYSYRALYAWQKFGPYISVKLAFPLAQMLLFLFMGRLAGLQDPLYIVIGNILLLPATNGVAGVSMTISGERDFRTLPYLIASPASRAPLFLGRSLVHIIDGVISTCGLGLILGSLSLRTREAWTITSMVSMAFYILSGVNFPVAVLPTFLQAISYSLPLTRGIAAARQALNGADWFTIRPLVTGELLVGLIYAVAGYFLFTWFEKLSLVDGQIETV